MKEIFLSIVKETAPHISEQDLCKPVRDIGIDSIDLTVIRVGLEKHFTHEIKDSVWFSFNTLQEVFDYFSANGLNHHEQPVPSRNIQIEKEIEIAMPQMANSALSESWLLKELGDIHWKLLSDGLEKKSSEVKDEQGKRLYATFTRICYTCSPLNNFKENQVINFKGSLKRFGNAVYISTIKAACEDSIITAKLMTSFSVRSSNDNAKIEKSKPKERVNHIEELKGTPEFLNDYRLMRKGFTDSWKINKFEISLGHTIVHKQSYTINPYHDINGVGLLYFAAYPLIADSELINVFKEILSNNDWVGKYHTVCRDVYYFANCNVNETIIVSLNNFKVVDNNQIVTDITLSRQSDKITLARIFTVKEISS